MLTVLTSSSRSKRFSFSLFQRLFANDDEKFIFFHLLHNTVIGCKIFIEFSFDQRRQKGTSDFLDALEGFLIVINV